MENITTCLKNYIKKKLNKNFLQFLFVVITVLLIFSTLFFTGCVKKETVKLYFAKYEDNSSFLVFEYRDVVKDENFYKTVIEELIKGPKDEQLYPTIPSSTKVYSVKVKDGLAIVDFSKEIITDTSKIPHSSTTEILAIFSIVNTLTEFDEIQKVRITIEGKKEGKIDDLYIEDFWGHVGIYEDFTRNEQVLLKNQTE